MQGNRIRGVPADDRAGSTTVRPAGLLSGVSEGNLDGVDRDPLRAWAEGLAGSRLYGDVSVDELVAWAKRREREYETGELLDRELGLAEPLMGDDLMRAAAADLRVRGVALDDASQEELLAALQRVSS